jgi:hypothetical protein
VASPEARRKGWRRTLGVVGVAALAGAAVIPVTVIVGAVLTPALWKLESTSGLELAGHSGPADWVSWSLWTVLTVGITAAVVALRRRLAYAAPSDSRTK